MNHIRTLAQTSSGVHRLLLTFATAFLVIPGLLAMHTLASGLTAEHRTAPNATVKHATSMETSAAGMLDAATGVSSDDSAEHCAGDCGGGSGEMPHHSMLMVACVLALLSGAIVLLAPMLLARLSFARASLRVHSRSVLAALPHPRPPSLIVLSISRT